MTFSAYHIENVIPLRNEHYFTFLCKIIQNAKKRIWASIFIVNPTVDNDSSLAIRSLIKRLSYAKWRNVDVKVIVGDSNVRNIRIANETTLAYMKQLGIPARKFVGTYRRSLHSKYVIIDDYMIIVGSHNWTPGAALLHDEDSVALFSREMNLLLCDEFAMHWGNASTLIEVDSNE
jgi:phosphatidylserine/phosphatidylglycerophosphate/cardiolipin synthase-like enzyme